MKSPLQGAIQGVDQPSPTTQSEREFQTRKPEIKVVGIGGGGNNTIDRIMSEGIQEVEKIAINTDQAHLKRIDADKKIPIGRKITGGRGAGGSIKVGRRATKNCKSKLREVFSGSDLVFLACGLGGGTGTGGAPIAAKIAKEEGALVTGVVTMPFKVEKRHKNAKKGIKELRKHADSVIVIDNNRLYDMAAKLPMRYAFTMADEVLTSTLKGLTETIMIPSLINLDFADVKAIMESGNIMLVGTGEAEGKNRAERSVEQALACPLLGNIDYSTAEGVIMHVSGADVSISEANRIGRIVRNHVKPRAQRILGARIDRGLGDSLQTILLVSGPSSPLLLGPASENKTNTPGESSSENAEAPLKLNLDYL